MTDGFGIETVCASTVFQHIWCVSHSLCLAVTGEFPDSTDPDEWVTLCPKMCVCVVGSNICALNFSSMQNILYLYLPSSLYHPTNTHQQTHKHTTCSLQDVTLIQYPLSFHVNCVIHKSLLCPLPDVPTLMPWIISENIISLRSIWWLTPTNKWQSRQPPDTRPWLKISRLPGYCGYLD